MSRVTGNPLAYLTAKWSSAAACRGSRTFTGARQNLYLHAGEARHLLFLWGRLCLVGTGVWCCFVTGRTCICLQVRRWMTLIF